MITVFYHRGCPDGMAAAMYARRVLPDDTIFLPIFWDDDVIKKLHPASSEIFFLDVAPPASILNTLLDHGNVVTVIDHHLATKENLGDIAHANFELVFQEKKSGVILTWEYFNDDSPPAFALMVQAGDFFEQDPGVMEFKAALGSYQMDIGNWDSLERSNGIIERLITEGTPIMRARRSEIARLMKRAYQITLLGQNIGVVCSPLYMSDLGNELARAYEMGMVWYPAYQNKLVVCALRSTEGGPSAKLLAEKMGGGGHHRAAAFNISFRDPLARKIAFNE